VTSVQKIFVIIFRYLCKLDDFSCKFGLCEFGFILIVLSSFQTWINSYY